MICVCYISLVSICFLTFLCRGLSLIYATESNDIFPLHLLYPQETMETAFFDKVICQLVAKCFCPAIEGLVKDGMKPYSSSWLMGRVKNTSWIVIQATTELGKASSKEYAAYVWTLNKLCEMSCNCLWQGG